MNLTQHKTVPKAFLGLAFMALGTMSCGTSTTTAAVDYGYEDPYLYASYYPADVAYSSYYWADDWGYAGLYATNPITYVTDGGIIITVPDAGVPTTTDASTTTTPTVAMQAVGFAIRALARGESICPGQVTVTPKTMTPACSNNATAQRRAGVTIVFNSCLLPDGGTVSGTVDLQSNQSASVQTCDASTILTLGTNSTITNLSYTGVSGAKLVIPSQTDTSTAMYNFGSSPASITINSNGQLQTFTAAGVKVSDHSYTSTRTYSFAGSTNSYTISGTVNITDNLVSGSTAVLTLTNVTRTHSCCRPTGGTLVIARTGGLFPGTHTWVFTATCGTVTRDGVSAALPACI
jgi:hypothetical protein